MTKLTALERDLLICVERLVSTCEASIAELNCLENRSISRIETRLTGLANCVTLLIRSQAASMAALRGLLSEEASYNALDDQLQKSLRLAKAAEEKLRKS